MDNNLDHVSRSSLLRLSRSLIKYPFYSISVQVYHPMVVTTWKIVTKRLLFLLVFMQLSQNLQKYLVFKYISIQSINRVLPYLLSVVKKLHKSYKPDLLSPMRKDREYYFVDYLNFLVLPSMENFTFCLISILTEIAFIDGDYQEKIINAITSSLQKLTENLEDLVNNPPEKHGNIYKNINLIKTNMKNQSEINQTQSIFSSPEYICLYLAPALQGLLRAFGRVRNNEMFETPSGIASSLYPHVNTDRHKYRLSVNPTRTNNRNDQCFPELAFAEAKKMYPEFRPTINSSILKSLLIPNFSELTENHCLNCSEPKDCFDKNNSNTLLSFKEIACDTWFELHGTESLLRKICSTYGSRLIQRIIFSDDPYTSHITDIGNDNSLSDVIILTMQPQTLKTILKIISNFMNDKFAQRLDKVAYSFIENLPSNIGYPYKVWSHCLRLSSILLVRDILYSTDSIECNNKTLSSIQSTFWDIYTEQENNLSLIHDQLTKCNETDIKGQPSSSNRPVFNNPDDYLDLNEDDENGPDVTSDKQNMAIGIKRKLAKNIMKQIDNLQSNEPPGPFLPKDLSTLKFCYAMTSDISASCLQIIAKSITKTNDAESFIGKLQERIQAGVDFTINNSESYKGSFYLLKSIVSAGGLMNYFDCALTLISRFSHLVKELLDITERFLLQPNPTMNNIYKYALKLNHQLGNGSPSNQITSNYYGGNLSPSSEYNGKRSQKEVRSIISKRKKILTIMDRIRESAMFALCKALGNNSKYIESIMNNISQQMYWISRKNLENHLMYYHNAILTMGFIGLQLNNHANIQKDVIRIFNQNLQNFPEIKNEIFDCLALMSISKPTDSNEIFDQIFDLYHSLKMTSYMNKDVNFINNTLANLVVCLQSTDRLIVFLEKLLNYVSKNMNINLREKLDVGLITVIAIIVKRLPPLVKFSEPCERLFREFWLHITISMFKSDLNLHDLNETLERSLGTIATRTPPLILEESINSELTKNTLFDNLGSFSSAMKQQLLTMVSGSQIVQRLITNIPTHICVYIIAIYNVETFCSQYSNSAESFGRVFNYIENSNLMRDKQGYWEYLFAMSRNLLGNYVRRLSNSAFSEFQVSNVELFAQLLLVKFCHPTEKVSFVADDVLCSLHKAFSYVCWSGRILRCMLDINQLLSISTQKDILDPSSMVCPLQGTPYSLLLAKTKQDRINIYNKYSGRCTSLLDIGLAEAPELVRSQLADYILKRESNWTSHVGEYSGIELATTKLLGKLTADLPNEKTKDSSKSFMSNLNLRCLYLGEITGMLRMMNSEIEVVNKLTAEFNEACNKANAIMSKLTTTTTEGQITNDGLQKGKRKLGADLKAAFVKVYQCIFRITALLVMPQCDSNNFLNENAFCGEDDSEHQATILDPFEDKRFDSSSNVENLPSHSFCKCSRNPYRDTYMDKLRFALNGQLVRQLLQVICTAPLRLFTTEMMESCIACWTWIIAGRPSLILHFLRESTSSWLLSMNQKMGVFALDEMRLEESSPLNMIDSQEFADRPELNSGPHRLWIKFFKELLTISLFTCEEQVKILINMLQQTLAAEKCLHEKSNFRESDTRKNRKKLEWGVGTLSKQTPALDIRFTLVEMCLNIVQNSEKNSADMDRNLSSSSNSSLSGAPTVKSTPQPHGSITAPLPINLSNNNLSAARRSSTMKLSLEVRLNLRYKAYNALLNFFSTEPRYYPINSPYFLENLRTAMSVFERFRLESKYLDNLYAISQFDDSASISSIHNKNIGLTSANSMSIGGGPGVNNISRSFSGNNIMDKSNTFHTTTDNTKTLPKNYSTMDNSSTYNTNCDVSGIRNRNSTFEHGLNIVPTSSSTMVHRFLSNNNNQNTLKDYDRYILDVEFEKKFFRQYRDLIMYLLASEIQRLVIFYNPLSRADSQFSEPTQAEIWLQKKLAKEKNLRNLVEITWNIAPSVAVFLPDRLPHDKLSEMVSEMVKRDPISVSDIPAALKFLATPDNIQKEAPELIHVLTWSHVPALTALSFFSRIYPRHPLTHQYAIRVLEAATPDTLIFYVPQIVQGIHHDSLGYLTEFILESANRSPLLCHQLLWNMKTNVYRDEDCKVKDPEIGQQLEEIMAQIKDRFTGPLKELYDREFEFFDEITNVSAVIKPFPKGEERQRACHEALGKVKLKHGCYLPSNPDSIILEIDYTSGRPMQSAEKAPFLAKFKVQRCGVRRLEEFALKGAQLEEPVISIEPPSTPNSQLKEEITEFKMNIKKFGRKSNVNAEEAMIARNEGVRRRTSIPNINFSQASPTVSRNQNNPPGNSQTLNPNQTLQTTTRKLIKTRRRNTSVQNQQQEKLPTTDKEASSKPSNKFPSGPITTQACIFKVGDDVRQDILALQVIQVFRNIFERAGLEHFLYPYRVVATAPGCGVIECVPDSQSRDQIGRHTKIQLPEYFVSTFGPEDSFAYINARKNFVISMAAYSVVCYMLQVKDRHNGNIMLDKNGHIIHIDFGFIFEISPGKNMGFEPHIKLSREMLEIMGKNVDSPGFRWFETLTIQSYLAIRPYKEAIVALVSLMLDTNLPCFRGQTIKQLKARFCPNMTDREAAADFQKKINDCVMNWRGTGYDIIQHYQNQIAM